MNKKLFVIFLTLTILISGVPGIVNAELVNLASGKSVTVSGGTGDGSLLTDGNINTTSATTWNNSSAGVYAVIDLSKVETFNTLKIFELSADTPRLSGYKIEVSSDESNWSTVLESVKEYTFTPNKDKNACYSGSLSFETQSARYIKFTVKSIVKKFYIQEIEVYNDPDAVITVPPVEDEIPEDSTDVDDSQNFARGKTVAVSRETSGKDHTKVTDGVKNINSSANAWNVKANDYIIIDLGAKKTFDCVVLYEYSFLRSKGYTIDVSDDNNSWTNVLPYADEYLSSYGGITSAKSNAPHYYGKLLFDKTTAQYVKITIGQTEENKVSYIEEIEVYDQTNMPEIEEGEEPVNITLNPPVVVEDIPYSDEKFHIYLFIGQSNMNGRGTLLKEDYVVINNTYLLNSDGNWEIAQPYPKSGSQYSAYQGFNRYSNIDNDTNNQTNPALSFARSVRKNVSEDIGIGLISNARGGTSIEQWQKGYSSDSNDFDLYENTVNRAKDALAKGGVLKAIFWLQGDSCAKEEGYLDKLNTMVENMRTDLNVEAQDVPFIASQFMPSKTEQNATIAGIASKVENSDYISSEGTQSVGDDLHFDAQSQRLLGVRFAEKIMTSVYNKPMTATELYDSVYTTAPSDLPEAFITPSNKFEGVAADNFTVKNQFGENQKITGNYIALSTRIEPSNDSYQLVEYGFMASVNGTDYNVKAESAVNLTSGNAYGLLFYNLKASKTYYFKPYAVYKDSKEKLWTVYGKNIIECSVNK